MENARERISALKRERNAVILAHNYTLPEVQDVADFVGDSLGLSLEAAKTDADVIVFCGVTFMAETARILNPSKTVLSPEPEAQCAMAGMCGPEDIKEMRRRNPGAAVVGYVNSTADSKAEMDMCCTSSNVLDVVSSMEEKDIIFVPDYNLGAYAGANIPSKNLILWRGFCPVHLAITSEMIEDLKKEHPKAIVLAHPECHESVLKNADMIGSTEAMIKHVGESDREEFILATEMGVEHRLRKQSPGKSFYFPKVAICGVMKMTTLNSIIKCLEDLSPEVILSEDIRKRAHRPVKRMTDIK